MNKVQIENYDSNWVQEFNKIKNYLSSKIKYPIKHVGSTSVRGLSAKPIIDIDIIINDIKEFKEVKKSLEELKYEYKGDLGITDREFFKANHHMFNQHHLYVCTKNSLALKNHLIIRDTLRENPLLASKYSKIKKELAIQHINDVDQYCMGKTEFLLKILETKLSQNDIKIIEQQNS